MAWVATIAKLGHGQRRRRPLTLYRARSDVIIDSPGGTLQMPRRLHPDATRHRHEQRLEAGADRASTAMAVRSAKTRLDARLGAARPCHHRSIIGTTARCKRSRARSRRTTMRHVTSPTASTVSGGPLRSDGPTDHSGTPERRRHHVRWADADHLGSRRRRRRPECGHPYYARCVRSPPQVDEQNAAAPATWADHALHLWPRRPRDQGH